MILALPLIFAALGALLLYLIYVQALTPLVEALGELVPIVGKYIARAVHATIDRALAAFGRWVRTKFVAIVRWLTHAAAAAVALPAAVARFADDLVDGIQHLTHVTVHEIVKAFVNPVRDLARAAQRDATDALQGIDELRRDVAGDVKGIEGDVAAKLNGALDVIRNVDLPALERHLLDDLVGTARPLAAGLGDLRVYSEHEFGRLWDQLGKIPLQQLLQGLAAAGATAALVEVIANEAGLDRADCRRKLRNLCATDPRAWEHLLAAVIPLFAFPGLAALVAAGQHLTELLRPAVERIAGEGR